MKVYVLAIHDTSDGEYIMAIENVVTSRSEADEFLKRTPAGNPNFPSEQFEVYEFELDAAPSAEGG